MDGSTSSRKWESATSFDTKYRPLTYANVLGQGPTIRILTRYVETGKGWDQSYLFVGQYGSGKTTLGRIHARALLCENPVAGFPCDKCESCLSMLGGNSSACFVEVDAASSSGKESIQKVIEEIKYDTFAGKRHLYLFDEAHRLSVQAIDALLKPLEEHKLVCIFCTTEPESMPQTIFSRCAPSFYIQPVPPDVIASRLAEVCTKEGLEFDLEMLVTIAEMKECHIRDALKAIEGISLLGKIDRTNTISYLHLDDNDAYIEILEALGKNVGTTMDVANRLMDKASPSTLYDKLNEISMLAYQSTFGNVRIPLYLNPERIQTLGRTRGAALLGFSRRFSERPKHPSASMLLCDLGTLHYGGSLPSNPVVVTAPPTVYTAAVVPTGLAAYIPPAPIQDVTPAPMEGRVLKPGIAVEVSPRPGTVNVGKRDVAAPVSENDGTLDVAKFSEILGLSLRSELKRSPGGSER